MSWFNYEATGYSMFLQDLLNNSRRQWYTVDAVDLDSIIKENKKLRENNRILRYWMEYYGHDEGREL